MSNSPVHTFITKLLDTLLVFENEETLLNNLDGASITSHSESRKLLQYAGEAFLYHLRSGQGWFFTHLPPHNTEVLANPTTERRRSLERCYAITCWFVCSVRSHSLKRVNITGLLVTIHKGQPSLKLTRFSPSFQFQCNANTGSHIDDLLHFYLRPYIVSYILSSSLQQYTLSSMIYPRTGAHARPLD